MKGKTKWILVSVAKRRHRVNGPFKATNKQLQKGLRHRNVLILKWCLSDFARFLLPPPLVVNITKITKLRIQISYSTLAVTTLKRGEGWRDSLVLKRILPMKRIEVRKPLFCCWLCLQLDAAGEVLNFFSLISDSCSQVFLRKNASYLLRYVTHSTKEWPYRRRKRPKQARLSVTVSSEVN